MPRRKLSDRRIVQVPRDGEETNDDDLSGVGSSQVPETVENIEIDGGNGRSRKSRGRTALNDLYNLPTGERVKVSRNDVGQPIGAEAGVLGSYLGIVARNNAILPINYESWRQMPNSNKNQALELVKDKFSLEVSDDYVKHALGKKWRDNKIRFWSSTKGEDRERVGVASRQKQKFTHTVGSKSFARIANDEQITIGTSIGRIKLFNITHTKKDGSPITLKAAEIMEKLRGKKTEYEATASTNGSVNMEEIENQVIADVLGPERYGRVRCEGSFVTATKYFGANSSQYMPSQSQSSQAEVHRLKQQLSQFQAEVQAREAKRERKEAEILRREAEREVERERREAEILRREAEREAERERREAEIARREAEREAREAEREAAYQKLQQEFEEMMAMLRQNQPKNLPS
ncbi:hypothetical protein HRI_000680600 [Hibiscus trionum]|uniref:Uncharacterized protein n=1 Tax=Hibiscus trionum TaxID=183268 RepID=A0A9W7LMH2_HIBTR|nr:hypothetical protein HRI_000680600 [Hibiscus trionum]